MSCNAEDFIDDLSFESMSNLPMKGKLFLCSHILSTITGFITQQLVSFIINFLFLREAGQLVPGSTGPRVNKVPSVNSSRSYLYGGHYKHRHVIKLYIVVHCQCYFINEYFDLSHLPKSIISGSVTFTLKLNSRRVKVPSDICKQ